MTTTMPERGFFDRAFGAVAGFGEMIVMGAGWRD